VERFDFFATAEPDNFALARVRRVFTSFFDQATIKRFFAFAIILS
jgi:hypothetical protein